MQAGVEQIKVDGLPAQGVNAFLLPLVPIGEKVVEFDGCDRLAGLLEGMAHARDDLGLAGSGAPGHGQHDRRPFGRDEGLHHREKRGVDLRVGRAECPVAKLLTALQLFLFLLKGAERSPAQVRKHGFRKVDRTGQKEKAPDVEIEAGPDPFHRVFARYQTCKEHLGQAENGFVQHNLAVHLGLDLDAVEEPGILYPGFDPVWRQQFYGRPVPALRFQVIETVPELVKGEVLDAGVDALHLFVEGLGEAVRTTEM